MKKMIEVVEVDGEGLVALLGKNVLLLCSNYFYTGKLIGVNADFVLLENPAIVYETGPWSSKTYTDVQALGQKSWYVKTTFIESYGEAK